MATIPADSQFLTIESASNEGAFGVNSLPEPTEAQKLTGNYKMGRFTLYGLPIVIEQPRNSYRTGVSATGKRWVSRMAAHYGYVGGTKGADGDAVDVFVGYYPQSEMVYVVNQYWNGKFDEHKVMLAFPDEESARNAYLGSYDKGWTGLKSLIPCSISQFKWWLKNSDLRRPLSADLLPYEGLENMNRKLEWDDNAAPVGVSLDYVLYDVRRNDADGLLLDSVTVAEIMDDADSVMALDALVVPYQRLERQMNIIRSVMERAGQTVKPSALQITEPFKQRGTANVAAVFELSDGQTVSVFFHNPDVTPTRIAPTDELVSWKWMLNKKDITIVVAPERGSDLNIREVARRIMKLAEKNSAAFSRANSRRADRMQTIESLKTEITQLETELSQAQRDLEVAKIAAESRPAPTPEPTPAPAVIEPPAPVQPTAEGTAQPSRTEWEESVYEAIESGWELSRSDAQGVVEAKPGTLEAEWAKKSAPQDAALAIMGEPVSADTPEASDRLLDYAQKTRRALVVLGFEASGAGNTLIRRDGDITVSVKTGYEEPSIANFMVTVLKSGDQQHDAVIQVDISSADLAGPTATANKISDEAARGMESPAPIEPVEEAPPVEPAKQPESPTDEQLQALAEAGAEVSSIARNVSDPTTKDTVPLAVLRHPTDSEKSISLWTEPDVTRARNAVAEGEQQMAYARYDAGAIRMPTAVQLGLNALNGLKPFEYEGKQGWTNGHILDLSVPKVVSGAIEKYRAGDTSPGVTTSAVGRVISGAVSTATVKLTPIAEHKGSELKVSTAKGSQYNDVNTIILASDDGLTVVKADRKYFAYFEKTHKGPEYFATPASTSAAIVVRKGDEVVGLMMPIGGAKENQADIAKRAKRAAERPVPAVEAAPDVPYKSPLERVDEAYQFNATDEFKEWLAQSIDKAENSPYATAKAMSESAVAAGASIEWGFFDGVALDGVEYAVSQLQTSLDVVSNNAPINEAEGNVEQAQLERDAAASIEEAIEVLSESARPDGEVKEQPITQIVVDTATVDAPETSISGEVELDAVAQSGIVGKISKDGEVVGRIDMDGEGKAIVYKGDSGAVPIDGPNGDTAQRTFREAPYMVSWLMMQLQSEEASASDPNIGREWDSTYGRQRIARRLVMPAGDMYEVETVGEQTVRRYSVKDIEDTISRNEYALTPEYAKEQEAAAEARRLREEAAARQAERDAQIDAEIAEFTASMTPVAAGKARAALLVQVNSGGVITTRKGLVEDRITKGYVISGDAGDRRLEDAEGVGLGEKQTTKTGMDYAAFLISKQAKPDTEQPDATADARTFMQSLIDGQADFMDAEIPARLEQIKTEHGDDAEVSELWDKATRAYISGMTKAATAQLAGE